MEAFLTAVGSVLGLVLLFWALTINPEDQSSPAESDGQLLRIAAAIIFIAVVAGVVILALPYLWIIGLIIVGIIALGILGFLFQKILRPLLPRAYRMMKAMLRSLRERIPKLMRAMKRSIQSFGRMLLKALRVLLKPSRITRLTNVLRSLVMRAVAVLRSLVQRTIKALRKTLSTLRKTVSHVLERSPSILRLARGIERLFYRALRALIKTILWAERRLTVSKKRRHQTLHSAYTFRQETVSRESDAAHA